MYKILITQKAYYINRYYMQNLNSTLAAVFIINYNIIILLTLSVINSASLVFRAVSENLTLHQLI